MEDKKRILAEICALAPTIAVRDCIRKFVPDRGFKAQEKQFISVGIDHLIDTINYIKPPNMRTNISDYTKQGLIFHVITRIGCLFSEQCESCNQSYCVKIDSPSLLNCENCGQEVHHDCLSRKLEIPTEELTAALVKSKLNPYNIEQLSYICLPCKRNAHNDGDIKKSVLRVESNAGNQQETTDQTPDATVDPVESTSAPADGDASVPDQSSTPQPIPGTAPGTNSNNQLPPSEDAHGVQPSEQTNSQRSSNSKPPSHPANFPNVCKAYLKSSCTRGSGCTADHPIFCQKLLQHGLRAPNGCDGKSCHDLHPPICQRSLRSKKCFFRGCKRVHLRGTIRTRQRERQSRTNISPSSTDSTNSTNNGDTTPSNNNFLQTVRLLKGEILEMLDTRFAILKSEMVQGQPTPQGTTQQPRPQSTSTQAHQTLVPQIAMPTQAAQLQPPQLYPSMQQGMMTYPTLVGMQASRNNQMPQNYYPPVLIQPQAYA